MNNKEKIDFVINDLSVASLILIKKLEEYYNEEYGDNIEEPLDINCYIAGGAAVNLFIGGRMTGDIDFTIDKRIPLKEINLKNDKFSIFIDPKFNPQLGLIHDEYIENSIEIDFFKKEKNKINLKAFVFSPTDLVISKLTRWSETDKKDVKKLIVSGLVNKNTLKNKIDEALAGYILPISFLKYNIEEALSYFDEINIKEQIEMSNLSIDSRELYSREELEIYFKNSLVDRYMELKYNEKNNLLNKIKRKVLKK